MRIEPFIAGAVAGILAHRNSTSEHPLVTYMIAGICISCMLYIYLEAVMRVVRGKERTDQEA